MSRMWEQYYQEMKLFETQQVLDSLLANIPAPKILEAGCGSASHYQLKPDSTLVGIDVSQKQLNRNKALSEKILGDIQTYDLSGSNFGAIICHNVLEHLDHPEKALVNFVRALSYRGVIVIVAPNLFSAKGLLVKFTPHWFHVFARRVLFGDKRTDFLNDGPFPTPFRFSMTPSRVRAFARLSGLRIRYFRKYEGYEGWILRRRSRFIWMLYKTAQVLVKSLTFGKHDILLATYAMIMSKV